MVAAVPASVIKSVTEAVGPGIKEPVAGKGMTESVAGPGMTESVVVLGMTESVACKGMTESVAGTGTGARASSSLFGVLAMAMCTRASVSVKC